MQIIVKQWPEMVEGSSRYDPQSQFWYPQKRPKNHHFGVIFWTVGTVITGGLQEVTKSSYDC